MSKYSKMPGNKILLSSSQILANTKTLLFNLSSLLICSCEIFLRILSILGLPAKITFGDEDSAAIVFWSFLVMVNIESNILKNIL